MTISDLTGNVAVSLGRQRQFWLSRSLPDIVSRHAWDVEDAAARSPSADAAGTEFKTSVTPAVTESNCSGNSSTLANAGVARPKHNVAAASNFRVISTPILVDG